MSRCLSAGTSDLSAMACLRSPTVLSVAIVICSLSSLGPGWRVNGYTPALSRAGQTPFTLMTISDEEEGEEDASGAGVESDMAARSKY